MNITKKRGLLLGTALLAGAGLVGAVAVAAEMGPRDPASMPEFHGKVAQYDVTPRGDIDGLILADGTEVHFPPHLGAQIAVAVRPGDDVTIHGEKVDTVLRAGSVAGPDGKAVVDRGPPARGPGGPGGPDAGPGAGPRGAGETIEDTGVVKMQLHGPRGELNGVLLQDGTMVHLPPQEASRLASDLKPGQTVAVRGDGVDGKIGRSIEARAFGPSMDKLTQIAAPPPPPGPGPRPGRGPGPGPRPPFPPDAPAAPPAN